MTDDGVVPTSIEIQEDGCGPRPGQPRHPLDALIYRIARYRNHVAQATRDPGPGGNADEWATERTNHGLACAQRLDGDRSDNWESAIAAFKDALTVWTRERNPQQWAAACFNLGVAYRDRLADEREENQEQAISALTDALSVSDARTPSGRMGRCQPEPRHRLLGAPGRRARGKLRAGDCHLRRRSVGLDPRREPGRLGNRSPEPRHCLPGAPGRQPPGEPRPGHLRL
jgi:hypothetical protein